MKSKATISETIVRNKITIISFFCSLLVIWIHTYNLETYGIGSNSIGFSKVVFYIENTWGNLTQIAVPFFFFISGYLFYRTFSLDSIKYKYISRLHSVLIPYLIWCTIYYFYFVVLTNLPVVGDLMNSEPKALSLIDWLESLWPKEYYTLWFLKEIIIYIAICPLLFFLLKNKYIGAVITILLLINAQFDLISVPLSGYCYYVSGAYISINFKNIEYIKKKSFTVISCIAMLLVIGFRFRVLISPFVCLIFFVSTWFILDIFTIKEKYPWWMKISFFTYVAHDILLEAYEKLFYVLLGKNALFALLDYIIVPLMVFVSLVVLAAVIRKWTPKIWKVLTGMR